MDKLIKMAKKLDLFFKVLQRIIKLCIIVVVCVLGALNIANMINTGAIIANGSY